MSHNYDIMQLLVVNLEKNNHSLKIKAKNEHKSQSIKSRRLNLTPVMMSKKYFDWNKVKANEINFD